MASNIKINKIHTFTGTGAPADGDQLVLNDSQHPVGSIYVDDSGIVYNRTQANKVAADWASSSGSSSYLVAEKILTDAQIKALPTTEVEILPAPGVNRVIIPLYAVASITWTANYTNINANSTLHLKINTFYPFAYLDEANGGGVTGFLAQSADSIMFSSPISRQESGRIMAEDLPTSEVMNQPLGIRANNAGSGDFTGGNASNIMKVTVYYVIVDL